jgi:hypothetical protein
MIAALRVVARAYRHLSGNGYLYVWANLAFLVLSLPIVTMPAAWAGLCRLGYGAIRQPNADWNDLIVGFREFVVRGAFMALLNAAVLFINVTNLLSYTGVSALDWGLRLLWILILVAWFSIQFYLYPLYHAMQQPSLMGAFRNAAVMVLLNPVFTLTLSVILLVIWSISSVLFALWFVLTFAFMSVIANIAVQDRIRKAGFDRPRDDVAPVEDEIIYGSS